MTKLQNSKLADPNKIDRNDLLTRWGLTGGSWGFIPGLVDYWAMNLVDRSAGTVAGNHRGTTLSYNGNPQYKSFNGVIPYVEFDGTGDFLSIADDTQFDISGTETFWQSSERGLTVGGWFWVDGAGATDGLISKFTSSGNQKSYLLYTLSNTFTFTISGNGSTEGSIGFSSTFSTGQWYFVVGRFKPGTSIDIFVDGVKATTSTAVSSLFNSSAAFQIGAYNAGTQNFDGRASLPLLSANALSDAFISMLYQQSVVLFTT